MSASTALSRIAGPLALVLVATSCSGGTGDGGAREPEPAASDAAPVWGDSPGIIAHTEDYRVLVTLDPETGEELHRIDLGDGRGGLELSDRTTRYGFFVYPSAADEGSSLTTAFSKDFGYLALVEGDGSIIVHRLSDRETIAEFDTVGDDISSTDPQFRWLGFGSDGEHLYFMELRTSSLHSVPFLEEGAEPALVQEEAEYRGLENLIGDEPPLDPVELAETRRIGADSLHVEGVRADNGVLLKEVAILTNDGDEAYDYDRRSVYDHFTPTEDGSYIGFDMGSEDSQGSTVPGPVIEFTLDSEGGVSEWNPVLDEHGVDAYALSPGEDQIAVSKDGAVFILPREGGGEPVRLETNEDEQYRLLGWT